MIHGTPQDMEFHPPIDESVAIPPVDTHLQNVIFENLEGLFQIQVQRKRDRKQYEPIGKLVVGNAKTAAGNAPDYDPDDIVEGTIRIAAHYCTNKRPPDEAGPITFRIVFYVASSVGRPKRPSFEWTYDPDTQVQNIMMTDPESLKHDPMERVLEQQGGYIKMLHSKINERDDVLLRMIKQTTAHVEPLINMLQFMGYGWLQGFQMQTNAIQVIADQNKNQEDAKLASERLAVVGDILKKALPVLAEKGSSFMLLKYAEKMGMDKEGIKTLLEGKKPNTQETLEIPAVPAATEENGDLGSFSIDEQNPLATIGRSFGALLRPSQWKFIFQTLNEAEQEILQRLTESDKDSDVIAAYEAFTKITTKKLLALHEKLDKDQIGELEKFAELITKVQAS